MMTEVKQFDAYVEQGVAALPPQAVSQPLITLEDRPSPDILRLLAIGRFEVVQSCVLTLYQLGYARPEEWSRPLPTVNQGEVMRILTKRVVLAAE